MNHNHLRTEWVNVEVSDLNDFKRGDHVKCLFRVPNNRLYKHFLEGDLTVFGIQKDFDTGKCRLSFAEDEMDESWYYEHDFVKVDNISSTAGPDAFALDINL